MRVASASPGRKFLISHDDVVQSGRYVQSLDYIRRLAGSCDFEELCCLPISVRYERGKPVQGSLFILRLAA